MSSPVRVMKSHLTRVNPRARQIVGIIVALERFIGEAEERGSTFVLSLLEKQHVRLKGLFERRVVRAHASRSSH